MKVMVLNPPSRYAKNVIRDLFYGCWCKGKRIASARFPPGTLLYVASVLKEDGNEVVLLDSQSRDLGLDEVKRIVSRESPEVIVIPTSTMSFREDVQTLKELKEVADTTTMAFGSHVTFLPKISLQEDGLDFIVMREPEHIIRDFVRAKRSGKDFSKVRGLGFRKGKSLKINKPYPFIDPLDKLPIPDRGWIKEFSYYNPLVKRLPWTTAITSRGCPGRCNFCTSPSFYGNVLRARSPKNVVEEMEYLMGLGYEEIFYRDETFTHNMDRVRKICDLVIKKKLDISWICSARVGTVNRELMVKMRKAGCHMLRFGVESGVQRILDNINKGITVDMTRKTFEWANKIGMETHAHTMLGCIGETWETVDKTIEFVKKIKPTTMTCGAFTPYPGTEVFELVKKQAPEIADGSSSDLSRVHSMGYYNYVFTKLTDREVGYAVKKMYKAFYLRPSYILGRLARIKSLDELRRVVSAGLDVLAFARGGDAGENED